MDIVVFVGMITPEDLAVMKQAIGQGCEQVDADEWQRLFTAFIMKGA